MPTVQDVREYLVSATKCDYVPSMGPVTPWTKNSEEKPPHRLSLQRGLLYEYSDFQDDEVKFFDSWHKLVSRGKENSTEIEIAEYEAKLARLKLQYARLVANAPGCAFASLGLELQMVDKDGIIRASSYRKFATPSMGDTIRLGRRTLAVHDGEVPAGAVQLVLAVDKSRVKHLIHVELVSSDILSDAVFKEFKNFIASGFLWADPKIVERVVIAVSIWHGGIKFHDARETCQTILIEPDSILFDAQLRRAVLLKELAVDAVADQDVEAVLRLFVESALDVSDQQRNLLKRLVARQISRTGLTPGSNLFHPHMLRLITKDMAILKGIDSLELPQQSRDSRSVEFRPSVTLTLPVDEARNLLMSGTAGRPFWFGRFWAEQDVEFRPNIEPVACAALCIKGLSNLPYDQVIEETIAFKPNAEPLLRRWRAIWDRSFPDWQTKPEWHFDKSEKASTEHCVHHIQRAFKWAEKATISITEGLTCFDDWVQDVGDDKRDYRLHVIDDADAVCSMIHLAPNTGYLDAVDVVIRYEGIDVEGYPVFREAPEAKERVRRRLQSCPDYWNWPFYKKYLGRRGVVTRDRNHTAAVLADMALQGHSHAFLKGVAQKSGTWTVNLAGVTTLDAARRRLGGTLEMDHVNRPMYVQEHVPFTHEQRFYVQGGRVFASACSDRHFSSLDTNGRRLDSRIAVLERPSIDAGYYDRGITTHMEDRKTSAMFARKVREIARELRGHGIADYSIDMGLTERGLISVEVNTLHRAGPYNMRRELYTKQFERSRKRANDVIASQIAEIVNGFHVPNDVRQKAIAIAQTCDSLVQIAVKLGDTWDLAAGREKEIAILILLVSMLATTNMETQTMTEAA